MNSVTLVFALLSTCSALNVNHQFSHGLDQKVEYYSTTAPRHQELINHLIEWNVTDVEQYDEVFHKASMELEKEHKENPAGLNFIQKSGEVNPYGNAANYPLLCSVHLSQSCTVFGKPTGNSCLSATKSCVQAACQACRVVPDGCGCKVKEMAKESAQNSIPHETYSKLKSKRSLIQMEIQNEAHLMSSAATHQQYKNEIFELFEHAETDAPLSTAHGPIHQHLPKDWSTHPGRRPTTVAPAQMDAQMPRNPHPSYRSRKEEFESKIHRKKAKAMDAQVQEAFRSAGKVRCVGNSSSRLSMVSLVVDLPIEYEREIFHNRMLLAQKGDYEYCQFRHHLDEQRSVKWSPFLAVAAMLQAGRKAVVAIDADAIWQGHDTFDERVPYLTSNKTLFFTNSHTQDGRKTSIRDTANTGVFLVKNTAWTKQWLNDIYFDYPRFWQHRNAVEMTIKKYRENAKLSLEFEKHAEILPWHSMNTDAKYADSTDFLMHLAGAHMNKKKYEVLLERLKIVHPVIDPKMQANTMRHGI